MAPWVSLGEFPALIAINFSSKPWFFPALSSFVSPYCFASVLSSGHGRFQAAQYLMLYFQGKYNCITLDTGTPTATNFLDLDRTSNSVQKQRPDRCNTTWVGRCESHQRIWRSWIGHQVVAYCALQICASLRRVYISTHTQCQLSWKLVSSHRRRNNNW